MPRASRWIDLPYAAAALALGVVSVALGALARRHDTFPGDHEVAAAARGLGDLFEPVAYAFNELDAVITVGMIGAIGGTLLWRRRFEAVATVVALAALHPFLNQAKALVDRPRPAGDFPILDVVGDSSFPSGHTMTAVLVYGLLFLFAADLLPRRYVLPARLLAVAGVALAGTSRMWAGVHWFSDTWGALVWALAVMMAVLAIRPALARLLPDHPTRTPTPAT